jgi:hypothetical protein
MKSFSAVERGLGKLTNILNGRRLMAFSMMKEHKNSLRRCLSSDGIIPKKPLTSRAGKILHQEIQAMMAF